MSTDLPDPLPDQPPASQPVDAVPALRPVTPTDLRAALGRFATGVCIITCRTADGTALGLTANSLAALSLTPPLVLWSLRLASSALAGFDGATHFAVNVLADHHLELSRRFAKPGDDRFAEGAWLDGLGGAPLLADAIARLECRTLAPQTQGDHRLYLGEVERVAEHPGLPLVYQAGHYRGLADLG